MRQPRKPRPCPEDWYFEKPGFTNVDIWILAIGYAGCFIAIAAWMKWG